MNRPYVLIVVAFLFSVGCTRSKIVVTPEEYKIATTLRFPLSQCRNNDGLPDPACTPGAVRTTNKQDICTTRTGTLRPPTDYTNKLKTTGIQEYGYKDAKLADYEEDHLISLELGGDPKDPKNLWPEPRSGANNSLDKDKVEDWLHKQVCSGKIPVEEAKHGIATNWKQYLASAAK